MRVVNNVNKRNDVRSRLYAAVAGEGYPDSFMYKQKVGAGFLLNCSLWVMPSKQKLGRLLAGGSTVAARWLHLMMRRIEASMGKPTRVRGSVGLLLLRGPDPALHPGMTLLPLCPRPPVLSPGGAAVPECGRRGPLHLLHVHAGAPTGGCKGLKGLKLRFGTLPGPWLGRLRLVFAVGWVGWSPSSVCCGGVAHALRCVACPLEAYKATLRRRAGFNGIKPTGGLPRPLLHWRLQEYGADVPPPNRKSGEHLAPALLES